MKQFYGKKSLLMVPVPSKVKKETETAYRLRDLGFKGGLETGWKRADQLINQKQIAIEDVRYMYNWFARHIHTSYPSFLLWKQNKRPLTKEWFKKRGIIAILIWGGDSGLNWINSQKVRNLLQNYFDKPFPELNKNIN